MKNRDIYWRRYKRQETLYIGQWRLSPLQSRHLGTSHGSPNCHQLPCHIFWISLMVWNLFPFKVDFTFEKSQKWQVAKSGLSHLGDWCFAKKLCMRHDAWAGMLLWWSCLSPVAHSWGLLNHPNSFYRGMLKLNANFDADLLLYSLSHFECNGHTVHMPTQWHLLSSRTSTM